MSTSNLYNLTDERRMTNSHRNRPKYPQHVIDALVKRYNDGEQVAALAKEYKVSRPGAYLWIHKAKRKVLENARIRENRESIRSKGLDPDKVEKAKSHQVLVAENRALLDENKRLKTKLVEYMIKSGDV